MELSKLAFKKSILSLSKEASFILFSIEDDPNVYIFSGLEASILKAVFKQNSVPKALEIVATESNYDPAELEKFAQKLFEKLSQHNLFA